MKRTEIDNLILIGLSIILVIIIAFIILANLNAQNYHPSKRSGSVPTLTSLGGFPSFVPSPLATHPQINYDPAADRQIDNEIEHKRPLSPNDQQAKIKVLKLLPAGQINGLVYETDMFRIVYGSTLGVFYVEVTTSNYDEAKNEAVQWFRGMGFSQDAICNVPIMFYLNAEIADVLKEYNPTLSSLPPGCAVTITPPSGSP